MLFAPIVENGMSSLPCINEKSRWFLTPADQNFYKPVNISLWKLAFWRLLFTTQKKYCHYSALLRAWAKSQTQDIPSNLSDF